MSNRYKGAVISATPPSVQSGPGAAFAPGIWTTSQQMQYQAAGTWPLSYDPNFNQTVLLLHGDGTNGAQNNTFLDSSTNNFTITRNGNTTQGSFSPFSLADGEWSNYFDGSGDYLTCASNSAFALGTGDFCIEFNTYITGTLNDFDEFIGVYPAGGNPAGWSLFYYLGVLYFGTHTANLLVDTNSFPAANQWIHVAICRSGTTLSGYINGTRFATATDSTNFTQNGLNIFGKGTGNEPQGYMSNVRIVKGSAIYDPTQTTLTVPTSPLTAVSGTSLLTCQSNRFVDNSSNAFALTINGNTAVQPFSPFQPSSAYSTSVNGGSGYFDGSGDYLSVADDVDFDMSSGDFCVEAWIYPLSGTGSNGGILGSSLASSPPVGWTLRYLSGTSKLNISDASNNYTSTATIPLNAWTHVAATRSGTDLRLFINGALDSTNAGISASVDFSSTAFYVGRGYDVDAGNAYFKGYILSARVVKGAAVYTSAFTPPTAPLTAISGTSFLCNFTNAGIFDNTGKNNLETVADAQIDTSVKKYGTGSMEFDGTGDWLVSPSNSLYDLNGDFTIEFWIYLNSLSGNPTPIDRAYTGSALDSNGYLIQYGSSALKFYGGGSSITSSQTDSTSTWFHYAIVRSGSTITMYRNGTSVGSATISTAFTYARELSIGGNSRAGGGFAAGQGAMNGYIDDLRITKGVARYTANFTPPNGPFFNT